MSQETVMSPDGDNTDALDRVVNDPVSRRKFFVLAGGTSAAAAFLAACGDEEDEPTSPTSDAMDTNTQGQNGNDPLAQFGEGDIGIVNYALTLEYLEAAFYADVVKSGLFKGADLALIKEIGKNEQEHVAALTAAVQQAGAQPAPKPKTKFPLDSANSVLELAATVENLGAAAYLGQAAAIKDKKILASALAIHTVEGRHAAALNILTGKPATDTAFAEPADAATVLDSVKPFIVA
jgi:hypothetical protein